MVTEEHPSITSWHRGSVNRHVEHFWLTYDDEAREQTVIALVGPPRGRSIVVEFLVDEADPAYGDAIAAVVRQIEYFFIELKNRIQWRAGVIHAGRLSDAYSNVHWGVYMHRYEAAVMGFEHEIGRFQGFERLSFTVGELLDNRNWSWGFEHGVYCFVVDHEVVYVGRALGCTLGERIADQMRHTEDPAWAEVVTGRDNRVEVFSVGDRDAHLAAALEAFLIDRLDPRPRFNGRLT